MINYYHILGVSSSATDVEIKAAFKSKALSYHPDKHSGDKNMEELFKQVNEAHQVLSNPYKRSKHDMMLKYGASTHGIANPIYRRTYPPQRGERYYTPQMSNWKATAYAFLFAFSVALIITTGMYLNKQYEERQKAELLAGRRTVFNKVKSVHHKGDLEQSLQLISGMGSFWYEEQDMKVFKDGLLKEIKDKGDDFLSAGEYEEAINHYDLLKDYSVSNTISYLKKMAAAYQGMGEIGKALEMFQMMHLYGYRTTSFYLEMGMLYEDGMKDLEMALNYYQIGAELASSEYEVTIGSAYPIVINANMVPPTHYDIYMKVAQTHLDLSQYQQAVDAVSWTKEIWEDSLWQYRIEGQALQALGRSSAARRVVAEAKAIDPNFRLDVDSYDR